MIPALLIADFASADQAIDANTSCQAVVGFLNAHDTPHARVAFLMIKQLMTQADQAAIAKGQPSALAPLSDRQAEDIYIAGIEYCRDDPRHTLGHAAADAYGDLRDLHGQSPVPR